MADLDTIMSERPADEQVEQNQPRDDGRDDHGRFASQQPPESPQPEVPGQQQQPEQKPTNPLDGYVPIQTLDARLARQEEKLRRDFAAEMQQRLAQFQTPKSEPVKAPDIFEDQDAAVDFRVDRKIQPIQQGQRDIVENFSRMMAIDKFGEEAVKAAFAGLSDRFSTNPQAAHFEHQRIMSSPHPFGELVKWHKAQTALNTYGDDPEAWRKSERERIKAELAAEVNGGQPPASPAPPVLPTSFASARNAGPATAPAYSGPRPLSEIMNGR